MIQEDRNALQTSLGINVVVEAGAGTGKTTLLIDRLCLCVLAQDTPVEKLVALTFTEKAAAEMKTRFIFKLQQIVQAVRNATQDRTLSLLRSYFNVKEEDIVARAEKALARLDRASIGTIHGFCAEILKTFPLEAALAPNVQIDEGTQGKNLFETRWNRFLDEELGVNATRKEQWKTVLADISLEELKAFARELCSGKIENYDYYEHVNLLLNACREKQQRAEELAQTFLKEGGKPRAIEKALLWASSSLQRVGLFLQKKEVPPEENPVPISKPTRPKEWEEELFEEALAIYQFAQKITPEKQKVFLLAYQLVLPVCKEVRQDYREAGLVSFDDLIIKTRNLLRENLYVRRLLKEKFDVIFVDEFQDTDPVQGELLLFLAEEKPCAATRWQEVRLLPGKLFIVGDPKQSIYRFRGADITAYELFTELILRQGGKKFFLQKNFRSTLEIIETANSICSRAMVQQSSFQPAYVPIFTDKEQRTQSVQWLFVNGDTKLSADDFRHNQAHYIAQWIAENVGVRTLSNGQKLKYKDIALLLRASTQTSFFTEAFQRRGIPFNVEVDKDFFRKQEINDFLNFLQAVSDPSNKIAFAGVLRSPLVGMSDEELYQFVNNEGWSACVTSQNPKVRYGYELVEKFRNVAGRISAKELVRRVLEETFLPQVCAAAYDGPRSVSYLQQLAVLIETYHTQETLDAATFFAQLQQEIQENPELLTVSSLAETTDAVSVLTVHKSKGLEFPVVILADLTRQDSSSVAQPPTHIFSWQYNMHGLRVGKICDANLAFLEEEQKRHSRCEEIRILYVALTRAKEMLLLVGDARLHAQKNAAPFAQAGLFPSEEKDVSFVMDEDLKIPITSVKGMEPDLFKYRQLVWPQKGFEAEILRQWKEAFTKREKHYAALSEQKVLAPSQLENWEEKTLQQTKGAELGTICHRALELLLSQKELGITEAVTLAAQQEGAVSRIGQVEELLLPFIQSPIFKEIQSCKMLACELPFSCLTKDGDVFSGLIDVLVERPDGSLWVLDYKTDQVSSGEEKKLLQEKYEAQLRTYQNAVEKLFPGRKVTTSAVFVRTFAAIEL